MYEDKPDIALDRLNLEDNTYRVTSRHDVEGLAASLAVVGLINPPVVLRGNRNYTIVSGFGRVRAAAALAWKSIQTRVLRPQTSRLQCVRIAVADNTASRKLDIVEQARALTLLQSTISDTQHLISEATQLGLRLNPDLIERLSTVARMRSRFHEGLLSGAIALPVAIRLYQWQDPMDAQYLGELLIELNLSLNRQRELVDWVEGILARDKADSRSLIDGLGIDRLLKDPTLDRRLKIDQVRSLLKKKRFPAIEAAEARYQELLHGLSLPARVQLVPPPQFEGPRYTLKMDFCDPSELSAQLDKMRHVVQRPEMTAIFSIATQGEA